MSDEQQTPAEGVSADGGEVSPAALGDIMDPSSQVWWPAVQKAPLAILRAALKRSLTKSKRQVIAQRVDSLELRERADAAEEHRQWRRRKARGGL